MAYYNAQMLENLDHVFHIVIDATQAATQDMMNHKQELVETFTFAGLLEQQAKDRERQDEIARAVTTAVTLLAAAVLGFFNPALGITTILSETASMGANVANTVIANSIISVTGLVGLQDIRGDT
jgi:hypothetical protein